MLWNINESLSPEFTVEPTPEGHHRVVADDLEGTHWTYLDTFATAEDAQRLCEALQARQDLGRPLPESWAVGF